jgi:hypothetical protein
MHYSCLGLYLCLRAQVPWGQPVMGPLFGAPPAPSAATAAPIHGRFRCGTSRHSFMYCAVVKVSGGSLVYRPLDV